MSAKSVSASIELATSPERAFALLADLDGYEAWNPFMRKVVRKGPLAPGTKIMVRLRPPRARGMMFWPVLTVVDAPRRLAFKAGLLFDGLFDGIWRFDVVPRDGGGCTVELRIDWSGKLIALLGWKTGVHMQRGFEQMCAAAERELEGDDIGGQSTNRAEMSNSQKPISKVR